MRIGLDAKRIFHNFRGLGNYGRTLVQGEYKYYPENDYVLYTPEVKDSFGLEWIKKFEHLEVRRPTTFMGRLSGTLWRSVFLTNILKKDHLDIFHGLSHELPPGIEKLDLKKVVTIHDLIFMRNPEFFPWIDRRVYLKKFTYSCEVADVIIAVSEQTKSDLIEFLKIPEEKVRVVYQSCSPNFYNPLPLEKLQEIVKKRGLKKYILNVGALEERKNALSLVKAFALIKDQVGHDLVLVGKGKSYKEKIIEEIKEQGIESRVKIFEDVTVDELPAFYQKASLFCYPSFFEGFGIPIVEALYSGTPVITSKGSCFKEAGGPLSLYIDPHKESEIAEAILKLLKDEDLAREMSFEGRKFVEKFHWQNTTKALMAIYTDLMNRK